MSQVVDHQPSKQETLRSKASTDKTNTKDMRRFLSPEEYRKFQSLENNVPSYSNRTS
jgi:phosphopantetheinyl transferase (holo-ACP synthase)